MKHDGPIIYSNNNARVFSPVLLDQAIASNSANVTLSVPAGFQRYQIEFTNVYPDSGTGSENDLHMRVSFDGGSTYSSSAIYGYSGPVRWTGSVVIQDVADSTFIKLTGGIQTIASASAAGLIDIFHPGGGGFCFLGAGEFTYSTPTSVTAANSICFGTHGNLSRVTNVQFFMDESALIVIGNFKIFGVTPR